MGLTGGKGVMMGLIDGKVAVIFGVRNHRSLGWHIAQALHREGATLAFTARERGVPRVQELAARGGIDATVYTCDVRHEADIEAVFTALRERHGGVDIVIHSIAGANRDDVGGRRLLETTRNDFTLALEVSSYSLISLARTAEPLMRTRGGGSILTLSYLGAERVVPNYNVMGVAKAALECSVRYLAEDLGSSGIRVNAISAGSYRSVAARAIAGFAMMERHVVETAPLRRTVEGAEVGHAALYLCSDRGRAITGEVLHVDCGYNVMTA